jgi:hypothetical protein
MGRFAFGLVSLVVAPAGAACGGSSITAPCAELAPAYEDLVAQLVAHEGDRDPAAHGPEVADLGR